MKQELISSTLTLFLVFASILQIQAEFLEIKDVEGELSDYFNKLDTEESIEIVLFGGEGTIYITAIPKSQSEKAQWKTFLDYIRSSLLTLIKDLRPHQGADLCLTFYNPEVPPSHLPSISTKGLQTLVG